MGARSRVGSTRWQPVSLVALVVLMASHAVAQDAGLLSLTIQMPHTDGLTRPDLQQEHRSYVELDALRFSILATNESAMPLVVDQAKLRQTLTASLGNEVGTPVDVRWLDDIQSYGVDQPVIAPVSVPVLIKPGEFARWTVVIRQPGGQPFTWGEFPLKLTVGSLRPAISTPDGGRWNGRLTEPGTYRRLVVVRAPTTPAETARRWSIAANEARERGDDEAALQAGLRAAGADPSLQDSLALLYLATGRYKEAAASYERVVARRGGQDDLAAKLLAQAYVGLGDERKASEVLLKSGVPAGDMAQELTKLRDRVIERRREIQR